MWPGEVAREDGFAARGPIDAQSVADGGCNQRSRPGTVTAVQASRQQLRDRAGNVACPCQNAVVERAVGGEVWVARTLSQSEWELLRCGSLRGMHGTEETPLTRPPE
eukprot:ctg_931.g412